MKKYLIPKCIFIWVTLLCSPVYGGALETLADSKECKELYELTDEMLFMAKSNYPESCGNVSEKDIYFDEAYKCYSGSELFNSPTFSESDMEKFLEHTKYSWYVPMRTGDTLYYFGLDLFQGLNDKDIPNMPEVEVEYLKDKKNKWVIGFMGEANENSSFYLEAESIISDKSNHTKNVKGAIIGDTIGLCGQSILINTGGKNTFICAVDTAKQNQLFEISRKDVYAPQFYTFSDLQKQATALPVPDEQIYMDGGPELVELDNMSAASIKANHTKHNLNYFFLIFVILAASICLMLCAARYRIQKNRYKHNQEL